jgi:hypothetical protein
MPRTAIATLQTIWDCRWSRPAYRVQGVAEQFQPETRWVCIRGCERQCITEEECEVCPDWELSLPADVRH